MSKKQEITNLHKEIIEEKKRYVALQKEYAELLDKCIEDKKNIIGFNP